MTANRGPAPVWTTPAGRLPAAAPEGFAVLDVETTGFGEHDRVVQIALTQLDPAGAVQSEWSCLVDPLRNPGPVHIHGITPERLIGAPAFSVIAGQLAGRLRGRVLVAHNADFDYRMVDAELTRSQTANPVVWRLCTMRLAQRLEVPVQSYSLAALAEHFGVHNPGAHDARHDTATTVTLLQLLLAEAAATGAPLPLTRCGGADEHSGPHRVGGRRAPFVNPGRWRPGTPLTAGMAVLVVGDTVATRWLLRERAVEAGISYTTRLSERTSLVVCNTPQHPTRRLAGIAATGLPVVEETTFHELLGRVLPGEPLTPDPPPGPPAESAPQAPAPVRRVLVLGGTPTDAARARRRLLAGGDRVALQLTRQVDEVLALPGAEADPSWALAHALGVPVRQVPPLDPGDERVAVTGDMPENLVMLRVRLRWRQQVGEQPGFQISLEGDDGLVRPEDVLTGTDARGDDGTVRLFARTLGEATVRVALADVAAGYRSIGLRLTGPAPGPVCVRLAGRDFSRELLVESDTLDGDLLRLHRDGPGWRLEA